jgi:RHS repeat-associated protein
MGARPHAARAMGITDTYAYDANGNMTVRREVSGTQAFVYTQGWTVDNRLAIVVKSDVTGTILATTTIAYDGDGARVKKSDPSGTTYYLGAVEVLITGTTQVTTSYYAFGGAMVAMRTTATATLTYLHGDHLGSTSLTTNAGGQKVSEQRYKPYGEIRWSSGSAMPTDFTFTSQRAGPANYVGSLTDYVARFYSPALGRFISADTIVPGAGKPQAFNRYMYVLGNPLGLRDPSGHAGCQGCVNLDFLQAIASFFEGFSHRLSDNSSFGAVTALEVARDAYPSPADSDAYRNGESVADIISVVQGAAEIGGGAGGAAGAIAGGVACVGLTAGGCVVVVAPGVPAAVAAGGAFATHGAAMLAKIGNGPNHATIEHHVATNKNWLRDPKWSSKFKDVFDRGGLDLDDAINKVTLPDKGHQGPHPQEYHEWVYRRLDSVSKGLTSKQDIRLALESELEAIAREIKADPSIINSGPWR